MTRCATHNYNALGDHECPDCVNDERDRLRAKLAEQDRLFARSVVVPTEEYATECEERNTLRTKVKELTSNWAKAEKLLTQIAFLDPERATAADAIGIATELIQL